MKIIFDDGKEIEFDENEVALHHRERIFKKDGIWYITKIINKDLAKWIDETKPMIIEENKIPEKLDYCKENTFMIKCKENSYLTREEISLLDSNFNEIGNKINEILDYLKAKENKYD